MRLNKLTFPHILLFLCAVILLFTAVEKLQAEDITVENRYLELEMDSETTEFKIVDKSSNNTWYSNPPEREEEEKIASAESKEELGSQLEISYYSPENQKSYKNNYADSVKFDQYEIDKIDQGVQVNYTIGQEWVDEDFMPVMMEKEQYDNIIEDLDSDDRQFLREQYHLITLDPISDDYEREEIYNLDKEEVFGDYTLTVPEKELESQDKKDLINRLVDLYVEYRADYSDITDIKGEDTEFLKENEVYMLKDDIPRWNKDDIIDLFKESGIQPDDIQIAYLDLNLDSITPNTQRFDIPVEYRLNGSDFEVEIKGEEIKYPQNIYDDDLERKVDFPLYSISVLKYFGTAGVEDEGYMMVPEGSGGLINFNNDEIDSPSYDRRIYGFDFSIRPRETKPAISKQIHFPVFGLKKDDRGFVAIIEEGEALGRIRADVSGSTNSYNYVYPNFNIMPMAPVVLEREDASNTRMNVYQSQIYRDDIKIKYSFLNEDNADYTGMAHRYQDYLVKEYGLERLKNSSKTSEKEDLPFFLDVQAAVHEQKPVLGVPTRAPIALTTHEQTEKMVTDLEEAGISNIDLRYRGWLAGGEEHTFPSDVNLEQSLGSREEFKDLIEFLENKKIDLFPDVNFVTVDRNGLFDSFWSLRHASRFINNQIAELYKYNMATHDNISDSESLINSPGNMDSLINDFVDDYQEFNISGLSLRHMGEMVNSDFRRDPRELIERNQSVSIYQKKMEELNDSSNQNLLVDGGNAYSLPYVDQIVNLPLFSSGANIIDRGIPFMQIVLHGYVDYSGEPINLTGSPWRTKLKSLETGANPYFAGSHASSSEVKNTDFDDNYFLNYRDWLDEAADFYEEINPVLRKLRSERITSHEKLEDDVYITTYENGTSIIVNYSQQEISLEDITVPPRDYIIQGDNNED